MFINLFGKYLISKNLITTDQLNVVREEQKKTRVKLGLIAISEKLITEKQSEEINRKQAVMDKRFGDIAVELGYLTDAQVSRLLDLQGNPYMLFAQTVTDKGFMTIAEIETAMDAYRKEKGLTAANIEDIKSGDLDRIVPIFLPGLNDQNVAELIGIAIRTINRLISTDLWMDMASITDSFSCDNCALQNMEGSLDVTIGLAGMKDELLVIADTYAGESFEHMNLDALDSVGELINIVNGLFATALSYNKIQVELMPPSFYEEQCTLKGKEFCVVPMEVNQKQVNLIASVGAKVTI